MNLKLTSVINQYMLQSKKDKNVLEILIFIKKYKLNYYRTIF